MKWEFHSIVPRCWCGHNYRDNRLMEWSIQVLLDIASAESATLVVVTFLLRKVTVIKRIMSHEKGAESFFTVVSNKILIIQSTQNMNWMTQYFWTTVTEFLSNFWNVLLHSSSLHYCQKSWSCYTHSYKRTLKTFSRHHHHHHEKKKGTRKSYSNVNLFFVFAKHLTNLFSHRRGRFHNWRNVFPCF